MRALAVAALALRTQDISSGIAFDAADARAQREAVDALFRWIARERSTREGEGALDAALAGHDPREAVRVRDASDDPLLCAYERFLAEYDPESRRARGVFYTPRPLVRFLVRAAHELLVGELGVARHHEEEVVLYDPAAGTGTFLFEALEHAVSLGESLDSALARVRGTELLEAPHALAHRRFALKHPARALALALDHGDAFDDAALARTEGARVAVVLGNPPYAARSRVAHPRSNALLEGRDPLDARVRCATYLPDKAGPARERNGKWLRDDYVKFLRLAQWHVERAGSGVVAFALPHGLLDQATFATARAALVRAFDLVYALDLHGDFTRRERSPDGSPDGNVFRVRSGVCLLLLAKSASREGEAPRGRVFHADLWGSVESKLATLDEASLASLPFRSIEPRPAGYRFTRAHDEEEATVGEGKRSARDEYAGFWALDELFPRKSPAVVTARDGLVIAFTRDELRARMERFCDAEVPDERVRDELLSPRDRLDLARARCEVRANPGELREVLYRPFDMRWLYEHRSLVERPRPGAFLQPRPGRREFALLARRQSVPGQPAAYVFMSALPVIDGALRSDNRGSESALFARDAEGEPTTPRALQDALRARTGVREFEPSALIAYAYAVLFASSYRARYGRFHEEGFPRVPPPRDAQGFARLSTSGAALMALHTAPVATLAAHWDSGARWCGEESSPIGPLRHDASEARLYVGRAGYFAGFSIELSEFRVGSYRPAFKWLRDRAGRPLDAPTRAAYLGVLAAIERTRTLTQIIDATVSESEPW